MSAFGAPAPCIPFIAADESPDAPRMVSARGRRAVSAAMPGIPVMLPACPCASWPAGDGAGLDDGCAAGVHAWTAIPPSRTAVFHFFCICCFSSPVE